MTESARNLRTFYIIILTQTFSLIGSQMSSLAVGIWVFNETGNAAPLALAAFFSALPRVITTGFAGVLADRWDRRKVMLIADIGQGIATFFLMFVFLTDSFELWHLYITAFFSAIFGSFQSPAFQASITMLIPDSHRDRANAIQQLTGPASGVIAPIITGLVFAVIGVTGVMAIDVITFFVAVGVIFTVHIPQPAQTEEGKAGQGSIWKESFYGFRYLWQKRPLFVLVSFFALINFLANAAFILMTPYVIARTGSEALLGTLLGVMNLGAIAGGIVMGIWGGTRPRIHTVLPSIFITGICMALFGFEFPAVLMGLVLFVMLFPIPMANAAIASIMQAKVAPDLQGRVFAALGQMAMVLTPIAYLVSGPLVDNILEPAVGGENWDIVEPIVGNEFGAGMGLLFVICGLIAVTLSAIVYASPAIRNMEATMPDFEPEVQPEIELPESVDNVVDTDSLTPSTAI